MNANLRARLARRAVLIGAILLPFSCRQNDASAAYGTLNNFDAVNDTGQECHGFEIEIEDLHSTDITYTYDWNHYGTPRIIEDNSDPLHPRVRIRYESRRNPDGTWAAYTAIPSGPIAATDGHQFTNPNLNFGGEHFGVGYRGAPGPIRYHWLIDDGAANLILGPAVSVSTPAFNYIPPDGAVGPQVQAVIRPAPAEPVREFGPPVWIKLIRTTSHNNRDIPLRNLVSDDPDDDEDSNWRNGEPDEIEVEWELLQTEFSKPDGGNRGLLEGAPQELEADDEVVTVRHEFYKYIGPVDPESGEADADRVGPDGIHGVDAFADVPIVGDYIGSQMSAFDGEILVGLIHHAPEGRVGEAYPSRLLVIAGIPFDAIMEGALPLGMTFNATTGELSGEPVEHGIFTFKLRVTAQGIPEQARAYTLPIAPPGEDLPPHIVVSSEAAPLASGAVAGGGFVLLGEPATVRATPADGFAFHRWTENAKEVSRSAAYTFTTTVNRDLTAHFVPMPRLAYAKSGDATLLLKWPVEFADVILQQSSDLAAAGWTRVEEAVQVIADENVVAVPISGARYFRLMKP